MAADIVDGMSQWLIGQGVGPVYPSRIPEGGTLPCVVIQQISGGRDYSMSGPTGLYWPRVQLTCWGYTAKAAHTLANTLQDVMDTISGAVQGVLTVTVAFQQNRIDGDEKPQFANDRAKHYVVLDYQVRFHSGG